MTIMISINTPDLENMVSIITPAFRVANIIGETIQSVLDQTYTNWEMPIPDDCSPDNTRRIVREWCARDDRIKLIELERNGGPAMARNAALERATGRWIPFLDSDDLCLPNKLERSIDHAHRTHGALVFTGFRRISANGGVLGRYIGVPSSLSYRQLLGNTSIATATVLIDRSLAGDIRMRKNYYDDFDCWLQILKQGHVAQYHILGRSSASIYVMAGVTLNLIAKASYDINEVLISGRPDSGRILEDEARLDEKPFIRGVLNGDKLSDNYFVSAGFGVGVETKLSARTSAYIQPSYNRHILSNGIGIGPNKDKIHTSSLQIGIRTAIN